MKYRCDQCGFASYSELLTEVHVLNSDKCFSYTHPKEKEIDND